MQLSFRLVTLLKYFLYLQATFRGYRVRKKIVKDVRIEFELMFHEIEMFDSEFDVVWKRFVRLSLLVVLKNPKEHLVPSTIYSNSKRNP